MAGDQRMPKIRLSDRDVGGRQIEQYRRAGECCIRRRRNRDPQVLANFNMKREVGNFLASKHDVASEGDPALATEIDLSLRRRAAGRELPDFVKFPVSGQVRLRHNAEDTTARNHCGTIEKQISHFERQPDHADNRQVAGRFHDPMQRREASVEHHALLKKIVAGVGRKSQLRKQHERHLAIGGASNQREGLVAIEGRIGDSHGGDRNRQTNQVMTIQVEKFSSGLQTRESSNWCVPLVILNRRASARYRYITSF